MTVWLVEGNTHTEMLVVQTAATCLRWNSGRLQCYDFYFQKRTPRENERCWQRLILKSISHQSLVYNTDKYLTGRELLKFIKLKCEVVIKYSAVTKYLPG